MTPVRHRATVEGNSLTAQRETRAGPGDVCSLEEISYFFHRLIFRPLDMFRSDLAHRLQ